MNPTDELPPGSVFANQFRVIERIARGGMGTIYRVEQLPTGHPRALKVLQPQAAQDPRARERFTQEAQIAARIESEHVAQVIGAGVDPMTSTPWLALELLQGADLATHLQRKGRLTPPEVAEIMRQLGHALSAAHRLGVIHRDLKPENIFLADARRSDASLTVKVLDFGVAKWVQEQRQNVASTAVVGSPLWMAPEQLETRGILGPHTDVWAVGLIAFAMLTGRSYWLSGSPDRMSLPDVVNEIAAGPLAPASQRAAELGAGGTLPPGFDAWFARSVHRDGAARYRSVDEQMRDLLGVLTPGANLGAASLSGPSAMSSSIPATMALPVQDALRLSGMTPTPATSSAPPVAATMAIPSMATPLQGSAPPFGASSSQQGGHSATMAWVPGQTPVGQPFPGPAPVGPMGPGMASYQGQHPGAMPSWQGPSGGGGGYPPMPYGMPPVPAPGAKSSSGPIIALVLGLGGFLVLGGAGLAFVLSRRCESGQHRSNGHCCVEGTDWNSSRGVCEGASIVQTPQFNPPPQQLPPLQQPPLQPPPVLNPPPQNVPPVDPNTPGMTPIPPPPPNVPTLPPPRPPPPTGAACLGNWSGSLVENTGSRGSMTLAVSSARGTCARWTETWSSGTRCLYILTNCAPTAGGVRGTGVTLTPRCTGPVSATISCVGDRASFRESVRGTNVVDIGQLSRR